MDFRTEIKDLNGAFTINYKSQITLMGSCFSNTIGQKLKDNGFQAMVNPFGTVFNPVSLETQLFYVKSQQKVVLEELNKNQESFFHFDFHSSFNSTKAREVVEQINEQMEQLHAFLAQASHIFITLGTAFVYHHNLQNKVVTNCHKIPQSNFTKKLLSPEEIYSSLKNITTTLHSINPQIKICFTVSPVRHTKEGIIENSRSKAHLLTAVHMLENTSYFPAYEIFIDDLRDYRFYAADLIHPNDQGVQYVWEYFTRVYLKDESKQIMKKIRQLKLGYAHKPFDAQSKSHVNHLHQLQTLKSDLLEKYPYLKI